ncbi:MAG: hypothetical protein Q9221_006229 [Calogaya cf. arnoldii]
MMRRAHVAAEDQMARNFSTQVFAERATRQARRVPVEDHPEFIMVDLEKLEKEFESFGNVRKELIHLNRTLLVRWRQAVDENLSNCPDKTPLDLVARSHLKGFVAWSTMNVLPTSLPDSRKRHGMVIELCSRARLVEGRARLMVAEIKRDLCEREIGAQAFIFN